MCCQVIRKRARYYGRALFLYSGSMPDLHTADSRNDYSRIKGGGGRQPMSVERDVFVEWLATPKSLRDPKYQNELAKELGVSHSTLTTWKRDPRVIAKVRMKIHGVLSIEVLPDIVDSLKTTALDPENTRSVSASKLLIDLMNRADESVMDVPLGDMSLDELQVALAALYDEVGDRMSSDGT